MTVGLVGVVGAVTSTVTHRRPRHTTAVAVTTVAVAGTTHDAVCNGKQTSDQLLTAAKMEPTIVNRLQQ